MKDIILKIIGKQLSSDMEEVQLEFMTEGQFYENDESRYLIYDESEFSGMPGCKTKLELTGDQIKMSRLGVGIGVDSEIEFQKGKRYTGYYETPFGAFTIGICSDDVDIDLKETEGAISARYRIDINNNQSGYNDFYLKFREC